MIAFIILLIYIFNSIEIEENNLINEFNGVYISNGINDNIKKIFDPSSLNISQDNYKIYINGEEQTNSSNYYPFEKNNTYNIKVTFNKLLGKTDNMFSECISLTELDLSLFDTSLVTNMSNMFYGCSSLKTINLKNFNTEKTILMDAMFYSCESLIELDLSSFNTKTVISMENMFGGCSSLISLNLYSFDTRNVENMGLWPGYFLHVNH